jgi:hypothetical protein
VLRDKGARCERHVRGHAWTLKRSPAPSVWRALFASSFGHLLFSLPSTLLPINDGDRSFWAAQGLAGMGADRAWRFSLCQRSHGRALERLSLELLCNFLSSYVLWASDQPAFGGGSNILYLLPLTYSRLFNPL